MPRWRNGRRAGLKSLYRISDVEVRLLSSALFRGVAQLVERHVWDVEVPGSNLGTPTFDIICFVLRVWFSGRTADFQSVNAGSIPATRSKRD